MAYGMTEDGFVKKPYSACLKENVAMYSGKYPSFLEHESNLLYMQCQSRAASEESLWNVAEALFNAMYINTAVGKALDEKLIDYIGPRKDAQRATGTVTVMGISGTIIPAGAVLKRNDDITYTYTVLYQATIPSSGSVDVTAQCKIPGPGGNAPANTITSFVQIIPGVTIVNNDDPLLGGATSESDDAYRMRYYASLQDIRGANLTAIKTKLSQVEGVTSYKVLENKSDATQTIDGIEMISHSIWASVIGGTDKDIAEAIFHTKAGGIADVGNISYDVVDIDGQTHTILFNRGTGIIVYFNVVLTVNNSFVESDTEVIKQNIKAFVDTVGVGQPLYYLDVVSKVLGCVKGVTRFNLTMGTVQGALGTEDIIVAVNDKVVTDLQNIAISRAGT